MCCGAGLLTALDPELVLPTGTPSHRPIGSSSMGFVWRGLRNYCLAPLLLWYSKASPRGCVALNSKTWPPTFTARVTKVQASSPVRPSFSRRRKSRNIISQAWTPAFTARVTKVQASTPVSPSFSRRRKSRKTISKGSNPPAQGMNLNVWVRLTKI